MKDPISHRHFLETASLAEREKMDQIAEAIRKIPKHAAELAKA